MSNAGGVGRASRPGGNMASISRCMLANSSALPPAASLALERAWSLVNSPELIVAVGAAALGLVEGFFVVSVQYARCRAARKSKQRAKNVDEAEVAQVGADAQEVRQ